MFLSREYQSDIFSRKFDVLKTTMADITFENMKFPPANWPIAPRQKHSR